MTQPTDPAHMEAQHLDYSAASSQSPAGTREDSTPWFGYIGLAIPIAALLVGFAGMILFVLYLLGS